MHRLDQFMTTGGVTAEETHGVANCASAPHVLVVDDEDAALQASARLFTRHGFKVTVAHNGREAIERARSVSFDTIVSDLRMPDVDGRALLRAIRVDNLDVPFVFLTGSPDQQSAIEAIEYGAFRYLIKPATSAELLDVVTKAARWHRLALVRREAAADLPGKTIGDRAGLEARFEAALGKLWIAMQPIVSWRTRTVLAYEALVRSEEATLSRPTDLLDAADRLGRSREIGRAIRAKIASLIPEAPGTALIFVNIHPTDLEDPDLLSGAGALTPFAHRIVLEITERADIDRVGGLHKRLAVLRQLGYRIAIDDLGAGYAGLSSFASMEPDVVKADMSLVRGIESSAVKRKLIGTLAVLCSDLHIQLIVEGIETTSERDHVHLLGADALQGYLFARPERGFPSPRY
jgi:EAL domain-containing protein (putative c-di-GMP-specific phosphodiesterase class I)/CheY-like chemotaxis protein